MTRWVLRLGASASALLRDGRKSLDVAKLAGDPVLC